MTGTAASSLLRAERLPEGPVPAPLRDPDVLAPYLEDAAHYPGGHAAALYRPRDEAELAAVLRATAPAPVLVSGARSSLTGGATPRGDLVLTTEHLRGEPVLDAATGEVTAQPGMRLAELSAWLAGRGRWYPPVPTFEGATLGGVVACNAAGAATFKYGPTRPWVRGLRVLLARGELLRLRRGEHRAGQDGFELEVGGERRRVPVPGYRMAAVPKQSAGYFAAPGMDAIDLFIGSEGTLGVVTEVTLATIPVPPAVLAGLIVAPDEGAAIALCAELRATPALGLRAIEHLDARCLAVLREDGVDRALRIPLAPEGAQDPDPVALLFEMELAAAPPPDAFEQAPEVALLFELLGRRGLEERLLHVALPGDAAALGRLHRLREAVPAGVNARVARARARLGPAVSKLAADMIVPFERFAEMQRAYREAFGGAGLDYAIWGHISDGNVHPNVLPRRVEDMEAGKAVILALGRVATALGGCPLGEHGVGRNPVKQALLAAHYGAAALDEMRAVKAALDPDGRLSRGVLFPA